MRKKVNEDDCLGRNHNIYFVQDQIVVVDRIWVHVNVYVDNALIFQVEKYRRVRVLSEACWISDCKCGVWSSPLLHSQKFADSVVKRSIISQFMQGEVVITQWGGTWARSNSLQVSMVIGISFGIIISDIKSCMQDLFNDVLNLVYRCTVFRLEDGETQELELCSMKRCTYIKSGRKVVVEFYFNNEIHVGE